MPPMIQTQPTEQGSAERLRRRRTFPPLSPKKRFRLAQTLPLPATHPHRLKKSGRPHEQIWLRPSTANSRARFKVPAGPTLDELMCQVTSASLSPSHFPISPRPNAMRMRKVKHKASDFLQTWQRSVLLRVRQIAAAVIIVMRLTQALREPVKPLL
jgi:hypothetical protein